MLIEALFLAAALIGTAVGGWIDLKTTEVPDIVPMSMAGAGLLLHIANIFLTGSFQGIISAFAVGALYLAIGYIFYYTGMWGEADVLLLAAVGFLIPQPLSFFNMSGLGGMYPIIFILNTFIVGGVYSAVYTLILAFMRPVVFSNFWKDVVGYRKKMAVFLVALTSGFVVLSFGIAWFFNANVPPEFMLAQIAFFLPMAFFMIIVYRFALVLDRTVFRMKVPVSKLKEGDVLAEDLKLKGGTLSGKLFIGLTEEQVEMIRKERKHVDIKEGIRYGPTFFFSLLYTWLFGNSVLAIFMMAL